MTQIEVILGFDVGGKRMGVAVGQTITQSANPIDVIQVAHGIPWNQIDSIVKQWNPTCFVVGLPIQADQELGEIGKKAQQFAHELNDRYQKPVHLIDEHLSTNAALALEKDATMKSKLGIDATAAKIIIETWLKEHY